MGDAPDAPVTPATTSGTMREAIPAGDGPATESASPRLGTRVVIVVVVAALGGSARTQAAVSPRARPEITRDAIRRMNRGSGRVTAESTALRRRRNSSGSVPNGNLGPTHGVQHLRHACEEE